MRPRSLRPSLADKPRWRSRPSAGSDDDVVMARRQRLVPTTFSRRAGDGRACRRGRCMRCASARSSFGRWDAEESEEAQAVNGEREGASGARGRRGRALRRRRRRLAHRRLHPSARGRVSVAAWCADSETTGPCALVSGAHGARRRRRTAAAASGTPAAARSRRRFLASSLPRVAAFTNQSVAARGSCGTPQPVS